jgi:hypothetical protein
MNKVWDKILALFLVISLVLNVIILLRFNNVTEDISRNFSKLNYLERSISDLSSDLNKIGSKQDWVTSKDYKILEIDKDYKNATIMIYGNLKELENSSSVYLLYGKVNEESPEEIEWKKVPLSISYGLRFSKKIELPYRENYRFKILAQGPSKSRSEELLYIFFKDEMENRIYTHIFESGSSKDKESISLDVNIDNNYKGQEKFKVKDIKINVYTDKKLEKTVPIYTNGEVVKSDLISKIDMQDKNNNSVATDDGDIEKLSYNVKIKKDFKEIDNTKYEVVIQDYMGEEFKEEYTDIK